MSKTRTAKRAVARKTERKTFGGFPLSDNGLPITKTTRGVELECQPVGALLDAAGDNIRKQIEWPDVPTYESTFAGGDTEVFEYTENTIEGSGVPDEDKKAWADYLAAQAKAEAEYNAKLMTALTRIVATDGVRVLNALQEEEWIKRQEWQGLEVPEDPLERSLHYFLTVAIGNVDEDMMGVYKGIILASGRSEEEVERIEEFFRSGVGENGRDGDVAEEAAPGDELGEEEAVVEQ
jgi:hypothetical protein